MPSGKPLNPDRAIKRIDWRLLEYFRVAGRRQYITCRAIGIAWRRDGYLPAPVRLFRDFATSFAKSLSADNRKGTRRKSRIHRE